MKKIIILSNTAASILGFRKHLITYLLANKFEVYCFATDFTYATEHEVKNWGAVPVTYSLSRGGLNPFSDFKSIKQLEKLIRNIKPDVVFSSFVKPVIYGTIAAKRAGVPRIIAMLEGLGYYFTEQPGKGNIKSSLVKFIQVLLYKIALPKADLVLFLNNDDPVDLLQKHSIKTEATGVLGGIGLDLSEYNFTIAKTEPVSFIFVGRLLREKGIFYFLQAAESVKRDFPGVEFKIIGGFDDENPGGLKKEELQYYIDNNIVIYPGHVSNVNNWVSESSVFVLPSYYREGVPRSTQEAMAIGRAIITTDVPGCRDTVIEGVNGFLIEKWSVPQLVNKMKYFIENRQAIVSMGQESHRIAKEKYDGNVVNEKLLKYINC